MKRCAYIILPFSLLLASCQKESGYVNLKLEDSTFAFFARIDPSPKPLSSSKAKVRAHLTVLNKTVSAQDFGDRFLFLQTADGKTRRTYLDTLESRDIDFSTITIPGSDSLIIDVYWVFKRAEKLSYQNLAFDRAGLAQFLRDRRR